MRRTDTVRLKLKQPPDADVRRRRAVLVEAGLEHETLAEAISRLDGIPTARQSVTNCVNGHFQSDRLARRIVELIRQAFTEQGRTSRAEQITLDYMGWGEAGREPAVPRRQEVGVG